MKQPLKALEEALLRYFEKALGAKLRLSAFPRQLPLIYETRFHFRSAQFFGRSIILCLPKSSDNDTPSELATSSSQIKEALGDEPIFVFPAMTSWDRDRLIQRRVSFVVPGTQLYLPRLLIDLRERYQGTAVKSESLPWKAQFLLLYSLQIASLEGETVRGLARRFTCSVTTVSRAVRALEGCALIESGKGKVKPLSFLERGEKLWSLSRQYLRSPVMRMWYSPAAIRYKEWPVSGETALGAMTMVTGRQENCVAVLNDLVRNDIAAHEDDFSARSTGAGEAIIEAWGYDPRPLARDGIVDPCSLALAYASEADERIESALAEAVRQRLLS